MSASEYEGLKQYRASVPKAEGVTQSERYLARLAEKSFLNLWSYPAPFRDQQQSGCGDGKELCDLLVVCGRYIVIFSEKTIAWPRGNLTVAWRRWAKRAVRDAAKQAKGAERWITEFPERLFLDRQCETPFPIALPPPGERIIHRVVVARGAAAACRKHVRGSSGSLTRLRQLGPLTDDNLLIFRDRTPKGRHYTARPRDPRRGFKTAASARAASAMPSRADAGVVRGPRSGWVWRASTKWRPSAVGTWRSTIWMAANFSTMARGVRPGAWGPGEVLQSHEQAIGDERDEDVRLNALLELMEDGPDGKIVLELLECLFDFRERHVVAPQRGGVFAGHVRAQQVAALAAKHLSQFLATQAVGEPVGGQLFVGVRDIDLNEEPSSASVFLRRAELEHELVATVRLSSKLA